MREQQRCRTVFERGGGGGGSAEGGAAGGAVTQEWSSEEAVETAAMLHRTVMMRSLPIAQEGYAQAATILHRKHKMSAPRLLQGMEQLARLLVLQAGARGFLAQGGQALLEARRCWTGGCGMRPAPRARQPTAHVWQGGRGGVARAGGHAHRRRRARQDWPPTAREILRRGTRARRSAARVQARVRGSLERTGLARARHDAAADIPRSRSRCGCALRGAAALERERATGYSPSVYRHADAGAGAPPRLPGCSDAHPGAVPRQSGAC